MIVLNAYGSLLLEKAEQVTAACKIVKAASLQEAGCLKYDYYLSVEDPTKFVFVEEWSSKADLDLHFTQPAFATFMAAISDCLASAPEIRIFESMLLE